MTVFKTTDLEIKFVTDWERIWGDWGTKANSNCSVWKPKVPNGYHALGHFMHSSYDDPSGKEAAVVVKDLSGTALKPATEWKYIWGDYGSKGNDDVRFLYPQPPAGYVALGSVAVGSYDNYPPLNEIMCVRGDLADEGVIGDQAWGDWGSGARNNFRGFKIKTGKPRATGYTYLIPNSFTGHQSYNEMIQSPVANQLRLKLPTKAPLLEVPKPPKEADGFPGKSDRTPWQLFKAVTVPFSAIKDDRTAAWKVANSPFYRVEKYVCWICQNVEYGPNMNQVEREVSHSWGIVQGYEEQFKVNTGLKTSVTGTVGEPGIASVSVTTEFSIELGFSTKTSVTNSKSTTSTTKYTLKAEQNLAIWTPAYKIVVKDGQGREATTPAFYYENTPKPIFYSGAARNKAFRSAGELTNTP